MGILTEKIERIRQFFNRSQIDKKQQVVDINPSTSTEYPDKSRQTKPKLDVVIVGYKDGQPIFNALDPRTSSHRALSPNRNPVPIFERVQAPPAPEIQEEVNPQIETVNYNKQIADDTNKDMVVNGKKIDENRSGRNNAEGFR